MKRMPRVCVSETWIPGWTQSWILDTMSHKAALGPTFSTPYPQTHIHPAVPPVLFILGPLMLCPLFPLG